MPKRDDLTHGPEPHRTVLLPAGHIASATTDFELVGDEPEVFGDYELLQEIGAGGMGRVYKAKQRSLDRIVALKTLRSRYLTDPRLVQRLQKEAEAAAQLDHPGIVPVYAFGAEQGQFFFTMALVEGCGLDERLRQGPLDSRTAAHVVQQVAEAIAYAHRKGVVHRDLKPANILLDKSGVPKITDFGIARRLNVKDLEEAEPAVKAQFPEAVGTVVRLTQTGTVLGTPGFMSPEQSIATGAIGPPVDIWALGAVLYTCLTGRPPFVGATALETLAMTVDTEPVPPNEINPDADSELSDICLKCLRKSASDRFASAEEVAAELLQWREGKSIRSAWAIWRAKAARFLENSPELIPLVAGLVAHRFSNIQEGLFVGCALAGVRLSNRSRGVASIVLPAVTFAAFLLTVLAVRFIGPASATVAGSAVSLAAALSAIVTAAIGIMVLHQSRHWKSIRSWIALGFAGAAAAFGLFIASSRAMAQAPDFPAFLHDIATFLDRSAGWFLAVPFGFAAGAVVGEIRLRLDRFGLEPLPAFQLGATAATLITILVLSEMTPAVAPESSQFEVLGPGPALSIAESRIASWMSVAAGGANADVRSLACVGIFWFKFIMLLLPMTLGGLISSITARLLTGRPA
jgi:tRNA A-37 threonylcarbamoyl transferase component Bud32